MLFLKQKIYPNNNRIEVVIISEENKFIDLLIYIIIILILFQDSLAYYFKFITSIDSIFIIFTIGVSVIFILRNMKISKISFNVFIGAVIFFIIGIISFYVNSGKDNEIYAYLGSLSYLRFFLLIIAFANIPVGMIYFRVIDCIKKIGIVSSIFLPIQLILGEKYTNIFPFVIKGDQFFSGISSSSGLFHHSAVAAWFYCLVITIFLIENVVYKNTDNRKMIIYFFFIVLLTLKVKSIIAMLIIFLFITLIVKRRNARFSKGLIIIITGLFITSIAFIFRNLFIRQIQLYILGTDLTDETARFALLHNAFKIIAMYFPFGVGFSKYGTWYASVHYSEYYYLFGMNNVYGLSPLKSNFSTDTFWPAVMGETGVLGTIVYLGILAAIFYYLIKKYVRTINISAQLILLVGLTALLQMFIESLAAPTFNTSPYIIFGAFFVGIAMNLFRVLEEKVYMKK